MGLKLATESCSQTYIGLPKYGSSFMVLSGAKKYEIKIKSNETLSSVSAVRRKQIKGTSWR